ncbi:MAG TPA: hypothetical protein ENK05_04755 [Gammaproteobacteria bacterium]|nr:hypothetical protein [Gammaproteobacteria bacterium]
MCVRIGQDEEETVCGLMGLAVQAVICEVFALSPEQLSPQMRLSRDLGMNRQQSRELRSRIAELFDGLSVDVERMPTVGALTEYVQLKG